MTQISGPLPPPQGFPDPSALQGATAPAAAPASQPLQGPALQISSAPVGPGVPGAAFALTLPAPGGASVSISGLLQKIELELERLGFATKEREVQTNLQNVQHKLQTYTAYHQRVLATAERIRQADAAIGDYHQSVKDALPGAKSEQGRLQGIRDAADSFAKDADKIVKGLEGDLAKAEQAILDNRKERTDLQAEVGKAEKHLADLRAELKGLPADKKHDERRAELGKDIKAAEAALSAVEGKLRALTPEATFVTARDGVRDDLSAKRQAAATAAADLSKAESALSAQKSAVGFLESRDAAIGGPKWEGSVLQSQMRLTAMAAQGSGLSTAQVNGLLAQTHEHSRPVEALRGLGWESGALALARSQAGSGQALTGREATNLLDVGDRTHPIEIVYGNMKFEFASNERLRSEINQALFRVEDGEEKKAADELEEQIAAVLQLMMARWSGDEELEDDLEHRYIHRIGI